MVPNPYTAQLLNGINGRSPFLNRRQIQNDLERSEVKHIVHRIQSAVSALEAFDKKHNK